MMEGFYGLGPSTGLASRFLPNSLCRAFFQLSPSKRAASVVALKVKKSPTGRSTREESHTPRNMLRSPKTAMRSAMVEMR